MPLYPPCSTRSAFVSLHYMYFFDGYFIFYGYLPKRVILPRRDYSTTTLGPMHVKGRRNLEFIFLFCGPVSSVACVSLRGAYGAVGARHVGRHRNFDTRFALGDITADTTVVRTYLLRSSTYLRRLRSSPRRVMCHVLLGLTRSCRCLTCLTSPSLSGVALTVRARCLPASTACLSCCFGSLWRCSFVIWGDVVGGGRLVVSYVAVP